MPDTEMNIIRNCADFLALTVGEVLSIAATAPRRYFVWQVEKRSGSGVRTLCHPARELKPLQYYFLHHVLNNLSIHSSATAYRRYSSIKQNATAHIHSRVLLKLDFADFFNNLRASNWKTYASDVFPTWTQEEIDFSTSILFWGVKSYNPKCLAIGAPTSPVLSNALMYETDTRLQQFAEDNRLIYTRYADDITFSSEGEIKKDETISAVMKTLAIAKYSSMRLNSAKTVLVSKRHSRRITGLVITPDHKISLGRDRKRLISAMVHRATNHKLDSAELSKLSGLLSFAFDVEPTFIESLRTKYSSEVVEGIIRRKPYGGFERT